MATRPAAEDAPQLKGSCTSSLRAHTLAAQGLIHEYLKASYTSIHTRTHTRMAPRPAAAAAPHLKRALTLHIKAPHPPRPAAAAAPHLVHLHPLARLELARVLHT